MSSEPFWEDFYGSGKSRWSGRPNASLVDEVAGLEPGTALDLGCGEGADAIWLAARGWTVTGADISETALRVARRHAAEAGVDVTWERRDLAESMPGGTFDLVTASFLHSPVELPRERILRAAADRVAPGGTLLVIGHAPSPAHPHPEVELPRPQEVVAALGLPAERWQVRTSELREVEHAFAGQEPTARVDSVVRLQRLA